MKSKDLADRERANLLTKQKTQQVALAELDKEERDRKKWLTCRNEFAHVISRKPKRRNQFGGGEEEDEDPQEGENILESLQEQILHPPTASDAQRNKLLLQWQAQLIQQQHSLDIGDLGDILAITRRYGYQIEPRFERCVEHCRRLEHSIKEAMQHLKAAPKKEAEGKRRILGQVLQADEYFRFLPPQLLVAAEELLANTSPQKAQRRPDASATEDIFQEVFPYIAQLKAALAEIDMDTLEALSSTDRQVIAQTVHLLRNPANFVTNANSSSSSSGSTIKLSLAQVVQLSQHVASVLQQLPRSSSTLSAVVVQLLEAIVQSVQRDNREHSMDTSTFYACLVCTLSRALSSSKLLSREFAKTLAVYMHSFSVLSPNISDKSVTSTPTPDTIALVRLYGSIVAYQLCTSGNNSTGTSKTSSSAGLSPLPISLAWRWLHRLGQQLHCLVQSKMDTSTVVVESVPLPQIALWLKTFLLRTAASLFQRYQDQFVAFLQCLLTDILPSLKGFDEVKVQLQTLVSKKTASPIYYLSQDPYVAEALFEAQHYEGILSDITTVEKDKQGAFMQRVKTHQLERLRVIFNKISATNESRERAIASLLEKIVVANADSPEMLRYTLGKIVSLLLKDCQEDAFNEMEESHPLGLARIACGLGAQMGESVVAVFHSGFLSSCPFLVPRMLPEGISVVSAESNGGTAAAQSSEEAFLQTMGFVYKNNKWEGQDKWLARMSKVVSVATVLAIQSEQVIFTLQDLWLVLVRLTNTALRCTPPFFVPTIYEVILRIAAPQLFQQFGASFMQLLTVIDRDVLPKITAPNTPKKDNVAVFLQRFISSNGRDFMALFNPRKDLE